jgi:hypothetical protein
MRWGGYAKDIKGRDTNKYQFCTIGNKQLCLWKLDSKLGQIEKEFINTGSMIRDYVCVDFSKNREDYLYVGTLSGDFCCFQMKTKVLSVVKPVSALGVQSIRAVTANSLLVGCGDGSISLF